MLMPTRVIPRSTISGRASASSAWAAALTGSVPSVARGRVGSGSSSSSRRSGAAGRRSARPARRCAAMRRVTRSTSRSSVRSILRLEWPAPPHRGWRADRTAPRAGRTASARFQFAIACRWLPESQARCRDRRSRGSPPGRRPSARRPVDAPGARRPPQIASTGSAGAGSPARLRPGRPEPVRLRRARGHLRERLRAGHADADREPEVVANLLPQLRGYPLGGPGDPLEAADVEERLLEREPLDRRRRPAEDLEELPARPRVLVEVRVDRDRLGAEPTRRVSAHASCDAAGLRLVARRHDDTGADDDRPPAQGGIPPLLDRREERVDVGVQDRGVRSAVGHANICPRRVRRQVAAATIRPCTRAGPSSHRGPTSRGSR